MNTKSTLSSETLIINDKEFTILAVSASPSSFGICDTTLNRDKGIRETFYIGNEPLINIIQRNINNQYSNKILWQISSIERCGDFSKRVAGACDEYFTNNKTILSALQPLLDYIKNGLYVIYEADMIPTDGAGNFFWSSYLVGHELNGSSTFNPICRFDRDLPPAFLVPTENIGVYNEKAMSAAVEKVKFNECANGICFHLSGMFCALLSNHHEVTAAMMLNKKIRCLIIEPVRQICSSKDFHIDVPDEDSENEHEDNYLYTTCAKIPMSKISKSLLETFFITRSSELGKYTETVISNSERPSHLKGKKSIPSEIVERCEKMPDCEMLQSAAMIDYLTDEEIEALLNGETMLNDQYIINKNYYSSVTIAVNFLQYKNMNKFLDFTTALLKNEDLVAVHQYIATRLQPIMNERIYQLFTEISASESSVYSSIKGLADKYIKRYKIYKEQPKKDEKTKGINGKPIKRDLENEINSLEMAKKIQASTKNSKR